MRCLELDQLLYARMLICLVSLVPHKYNALVIVHCKENWNRNIANHTCSIIFNSPTSQQIWMSLITRFIFTFSGVINCSNT
jgi:hypothetical protein